jgi:hypothetical protein
MVPSRFWLPGPTRFPDPDDDAYRCGTRSCLARCIAIAIAIAIAGPLLGDFSPDDSQFTDQPLSRARGLQLGRKAA